MVSTFTSAISPRKKLRFYTKGKSISTLLPYFRIFSRRTKRIPTSYLLATYIDDLEIKL